MSMYTDKILKENLIRSEVMTESEFLGLTESFKEKLNSKLLTNSANFIKNLVTGKKTENVKAIEKSKGDFRSIAFYNDYRTNIEFLRGNSELNSQHPKIKEYVSAILTAEKELLARKAVFKKAFSSKNLIIMNHYNALSYLVIQSTCLVLANYVQGEVDTYNREKLAPVRSPKDISSNGTIRSLLKYVDRIDKGEFDKEIKILLDKNKPVNEVAPAAAAVGILTQVSPYLFGPMGIVVLLAGLFLLRHSTALFYRNRERLSVQLKTSADIIEENMSTLSNDKIVGKQAKMAERFRRWANKLEVEDHVAEVKADRELTKLDDYTKKEAEKDDSELSGSLSNALFG